MSNKRKLGIYLLAPDGTCVAELEYSPELRARQRTDRAWYPITRRSRPRSCKKCSLQTAQHSGIVQSESCAVCG